MGSCRCKMCGGHIHYDDNASMTTCEYCGTEQTVFRTDSEKELKLFNRANSLRMQNDFDKAQLTYDNILIDNPTNAEAHWGICLCRYGIEYVDSPNLGKKIPTCHRTVMKSIFDDLDYKETIDNADVVAKKYYETESKVIDKLQKEIISISQKEEPYDIFISYKENDGNNRTIDSIIAEEIYDELIKKGYKVFTHRKALALKEVSEYEPIIFAALMSSKVMLTIGSKADYFNSIWEKNEWSRFLSFMQDNHDKYLIPCYLNMESFDIPDELLVFDAFDLKSDNAINNLLNRIEKLFSRSNRNTTSKKVDNVQTNPNNGVITNMLERAEACLMEGDFTKVNEIAENILNMDYKCSKAYTYKMFANNKAKNMIDLINAEVDVTTDKDYNKALAYADREQRDYLLSIDSIVKEGINEKNKEVKYQAFIYCLDRNDLDKAFVFEQEIKGYKDVDILKYNKLIYYIDSNDYKKAFAIGDTLKGYNDVDVKLVELREKCYKSGIELKAVGNYDWARNMFALILDYKDANEQGSECVKLRLLEGKINEAKKLCGLMDQLLEKVARKEAEYGDIDYYDGFYTRVKLLLAETSKEIDGKNVIEYYGLKRKEMLKAKVKKPKTNNRGMDYATKEKIKQTLIIIVIVTFLAAAIIPEIIFIVQMNEKLAGGYVLVDLALLIGGIFLCLFIDSR